MKTLEERIEELKIINASYNCACMSYYDLEPALEIIAELQAKIQNFEKVTHSSIK